MPFSCPCMIANTSYSFVITILFSHAHNLYAVQHVEAADLSLLIFNFYLCLRYIVVQTFIKSDHVDHVHFLKFWFGQHEP